MSNESTRYPGLYKRAQSAYSQIIGSIRAIAKEHGYAIAVHGSIARDIDLIACPWTEKPFHFVDMLNAITAECEQICGFATFNDKDVVSKPHGRMSYAIVLGGGIYLDISVMPVIDEAKK